MSTKADGACITRDFRFRFLNTRSGPKRNFFKKLMKFANQKGEVESMTASAKFNVSWDAVKNVRHADKMIHKYLYGHVRTSLLEAPPNEWENVIFLPYQKFVGASHKSVWSK